MGDRGLRLDHILLGAPQLDTATDAFAALAGVSPGGGGSHEGFGTRNQLLSLGDRLFFEIIAPDPAQDKRGRRASGLERLPGPEMLTFCLQSDDLDAVASRAKAAGLSPQDPVAMGRTRADGVRLEWNILYLEDAYWGDAIPFVIDWMGSPHPGASAPTGCTLKEFTVLHPRFAELALLYEALGVPVPVAGAMTQGFLMRLDTPRGEVVLT